MNRKERRRLRQNPSARAIAARRREHQARRLVAERERRGLGPEVWDALEPEAREYVKALEERTDR